MQIVIVTNHNESLEGQSIILNHNGVWTLDEGSSCVVNDRCIYAYPNAVINVRGASKLMVQNTTYTAMMAEAFATLNIEDGSEVVIDNADILLDDDTRKHISLDDKNQYLIIGRNPKNLFATKENLFELASEKVGEQTVFTMEPYI